MMQIATAGFVLEDRATEIEKHFKENPWPSAERVIKQNCEAIRLNSSWLTRDKETIQQWLQDWQ